MRYNDPSHFERWKTHGTFPAIHDNIAALLEKHVAAGTAGPIKPRRFCDLCCSIGLLGQRIYEGDMATRSVVGVEGLHASIVQARAAGIRYPILEIMVTHATLPVFIDWLKLNRTEVLVARRCLSELFAVDQSWGPHFWEAVTGAGVRMAVIQGRAPCANPTHPLPSVDQEIAVLGPKARLVEKLGQCAVLVP